MSEVGQWVVVNDDHQDVIPAGLTATITHVSIRGGQVSWTLWSPEAGVRAAVPRGSQELLPDFMSRAAVNETTGDTR